jgi:hypothetical protein
MDRRFFIRALGASSAGIALSPLSAISLTDDWYANSRLGIRLRKPAGWHFVSIKDFTKQIDELESVTEDPELLGELRQLSGDPFLVINKYASPDSGITPTIQLYANPLDEEPEDLLKFSRDAELYFRPYLRDYSLETDVVSSRLGGLECASWTYRYTLISHTSHQMWAWAGLVRASKAEFSVGMMAPVSGPDASREELKAFRNSIDLT